MSWGYPGIALLSNELTNNNASPFLFLKYIVVLTAVRILATFLSQLLLHSTGSCGDLDVGDVGWVVE